MSVSAVVWIATLVTVTAVLAADLLIVGRRPHEPSLAEAAGWLLFYALAALLFGAGVWVAAGGRYAGEFYTGWLTEYSLSADNLFVFVVIMARFAVPRRSQQRVLLFGIVLALVLRGAFIAAGAAMITRFSWVFYLFGAFLVYTAVSLLRQQEADFRENVLIGWAKRVLPASSAVLLVMIAIGTTDLLFALDSIPAIFSITREPYLVFTANVFALMGLRQLYFLLGNLLDRLVHLNYGLAAVLGFVGVKVVLEALHDDGARWVPTIPIWLSLVVIAGSLGAAAATSLIASSQDRPAAPGLTARGRGAAADDQLGGEHDAGAGR
jgi:tellurite resistance protein TerC